MNYSEVESKVREATNDDTWGPHGTLMTEIAKFTFTYEHYPEVMSMIWKRMFESKKNWRRVYKVSCEGWGMFRYMLYCNPTLWPSLPLCKEQEEIVSLICG